MNQIDVKNRIYDILKRQSSYGDWQPILEQSSYDGLDLFLYSELGFNSLDIIEFIIGINKEFEMHIDNRIFDSNVTLRIIINYIKDELHKR